MFIGHIKPNQVTGAASLKEDRMVIRHIKPALHPSQSNLHQVSVDLHGIVAQEALTRQVVRRVVRGKRGGRNVK